MSRSCRRRIIFELGENLAWPAGTAISLISHAAAEYPQELDQRRQFCAPMVELLIAKFCNILLRDCSNCFVHGRSLLTQNESTSLTQNESTATCSNFNSLN